MSIGMNFDILFTIRGCEIQSDNITIDMIEGSRRNYTLENSATTPVEEDSAYTIFLSASNCDGTSDASTIEISTQGSSEFSLLCAIIILLITGIMQCHAFLAPSGAPQNLGIISTDDTTIVIGWKPVECRYRNGDITGYNVTYYHGAEMMTQMLPESDHTFTATGLLFSTMYTFEVVALSRQYGAGPSANTTKNTSGLQGISI